MINSFEEARKILQDVAEMTDDLREDELFCLQNEKVLEGEDITEMAGRVGETVARYLPAIKIYNALTAAINATRPMFEHMRKPAFLKITDDDSIKYDLADLNKNIPLLAVVQTAKNAGDDEVGRVVDYLLERLG